MFGQATQLRGVAMCVTAFSAMACQKMASEAVPGTKTAMAASQADTTSTGPAAKAEQGTWAAEGWLVDVVGPPWAPAQGAALQGSRESQEHIHYVAEAGKLAKVERISIGGRISGTTKYRYAPDGRLVEVEALDGIGVLVSKTTYDPDQHIFQRVLRSGEIDHDGCRKMAWTWEAATRTAEVICLNSAGRKVPNASGIATYKQVYDDKMRIVERSDRRSTVRYEYDAHGRLTVQKSDKPDPDSGCEVEVYERDAAGLETMRRCQAADGTAVGDKHKVYSVRRVYDGRGCLTEWQALDKNDAPTAADDGVGRYTYVNDSECRTLEARAFDGSGAPGDFPSEPGVHVVRYQRNRDDSIASQSYVDVKGAAVAEKDCKTWSTRFEYDERGRLIKQLMLNAEGEPTYCKGNSRLWAGFAQRFDDEGHVVEMKEIRPDGTVRRTKGTSVGSIRQFRYNSDGFRTGATFRHEDDAVAWIEQYTRDDRNRVTEVKFMDGEDNPKNLDVTMVGIDDLRGARHRIAFVYEGELHVRNDYFNKDGRLLGSVDCRSKRCLTK